MSKDFLSYNQQMKYLRENKDIKCSGTGDKVLLCRYGYFNIVNGYKSPFVSGVDKAGNHIYYPNTSIVHLNEVRSFDSNLRNLLLKNIVQVEEEIRSLTAYKFDEVNKRGNVPWYQVDAYSSDTDVKKVVSLISKIYHDVSRSQQEYIGFYMDKHKIIPTWVLMKVITFSNLIDFINFSKNEVRDSLCKLYSMQDSRGFNNYILLSGSLHLMRKIRNICAHNERVYCFEIPSGRITDSYFSLLPGGYRKTKERSIMDLLVSMKYFLQNDDYVIFISEIKAMLIDLESKIPQNAFNYVRAKMGVRNITHLDMLLDNSKNIEYNKF